MNDSYGDNGWEQLRKGRSSNTYSPDGFGLTYLFHNTPEKMPAKHRIFSIGRPYLNR